jgi:DNA-binding transcriptional ArsR family regulator
VSNAAPEGGPLRGLLELDRVVHEPARLAILTVLAEADEVEFRFVEAVTGLTRGNLSSHASRLEEAGYITVHKAFRGRTPVTSYRLTKAGHDALTTYRDRLRAAMEPPESDPKSP